MANGLDYCLVVSEFEPKLRYCVYIRANTLQKGTESPILSTMGLIESLLFYNDGFGIKYPAKVDMPLNKNTPSSTWFCKKKF